MDIVVAWILVATPSLIYFWFAASYFVVGRSRREHVERLLGVQPVREFYDKAYRFAGGSQRDVAGKVLPRWTEHVMPLLLCGVVALPVSTAAASVAGIRLGLPQSVAEAAAAVPVEVLAGFAGAYLWGLVSCIERFRVVNWTSSFVHGLWVRLLIGGVLGALVSAPFKAEYAPLLAFSLGVFPSKTLRKWLRRRAAKTVGLGDEEDAPTLKWSAIQGVTPELIDRLEEADVASPTALANADPFRLFVRTNIAWRHVLDLIDQAILAGYIGAKIEEARAMGIRGAIEAAILAERQRLIPPAHPIRVAADRTVAELSKALGQPEEVTRNLIQNLDEDAQVELVWNLWFDEQAKGVVPPAMRGGEPEPSASAA